nr:DUF6421 family protein [Nakamurella panacisegetis]
MTQFPRVWLDRNKSWAKDGFVPEEVLAHRGYVVVDDPARADVVVAGSAPLAAPAAQAVSAGAGLVLLIDSVEDLAAPLGGIAAGDLLPTGSAGLSADPREPGDAGLHPQHGNARTEIDEDLLARTDLDRLRPLATLTLTDPAAPLLRLSGGRPGAPVAATSVVGSSRLVVLAVAMDPSSGDLFFNAVSYAARPTTAGRRAHRSPIIEHPSWLDLKSAVGDLRPLQAKDGSVPENKTQAATLIQRIVAAVEQLAPEFPHDADYLAACAKDLTRWSDSGFGVPDFLDSLLAFHPEADRVDGRAHLVLFPMYTQNGNPDRNVEAVLIEVIWPDFVADLEAGEYSNKMFVPIRFLDFTPGYDTNSAVLFPETIAMREVPKFSWGAIFADREAARFRAVVSSAAEITRLALPPDAARLLQDQELAEQTFVMWDLIHDRTHMHGDLPFDPFMIKQRMPFFLYTLEELRCDLTAFRESVKLERAGVPHARLVQYAILFDRIFRFAITGSRVRNYDGLGGQLLFAWLHQHHVLHWTDNRLTIDWTEVTEPVLELGRQIEHLYWQSIDRSKTAHWLAAYQLVSGTVAPNPSSTWAKGPDALPLDGPVRGLTDAVLPDEFPLSMFYEALNRKLAPVVSATAGITG